MPPWSLASIADLAARQDGAVGWTQLRGVGIPATSIEELIQRRLLHAKLPRTYSFGHEVLSARGWWFIALLCGGEESALVERSAGGALGLLPVVSSLHVASTGRLGEKVHGLHTRRLRLHPGEVITHRGLRTTSVARTALDIAAGPQRERLGELLDRAILDRRYDHEEMGALLEHRRGHRGIRPLRAAVAILREHPDAFRSRPERRARDLLVAAGRMAPEVNAWFPTRAGHGHELDLFWRELGLDIEIDGPHHELPHQRRRDAIRDAELRDLGLAVARFPTAFVQDAPEAFVLAVGREIDARRVSPQYGQAVSRRHSAVRT